MLTKEAATYIALLRSLGFISRNVCFSCLHAFFWRDFANNDSVVWIISFTLKYCFRVFNLLSEQLQIQIFALKHLVYEFYKLLHSKALKHFSWLQNSSQTMIIFSQFKQTYLHYCNFVSWTYRWSTAGMCFGKMNFCTRIKQTEMGRASNYFMNKSHRGSLSSIKILPLSAK